jgi:hypothetical protein
VAHPEGDQVDTFTRHIFHPSATLRSLIWPSASVF